MVASPNIKLDPASTSNVWTTGKMPPTTIVCHTMSGFYEGTSSWFKNPAAVASSNYGIAEDGRAACYVDPFGPLSPFANGAIANPDAEFLSVYARNGNRNPNFWTISIEHEDKRVPNHQITNYPSQFEASTLVSAWLCQSFKLDPSAPGTFLGHYQIDGVNRASCPGWSASTWTSYVGEVEHLLGAPGAVPAPLPVSLSMEERMHRIEMLIAANGIAFDFDELPNGALVPKGTLVGEAALQYLNDPQRQSSAFMAIFEILFKMGKHGLS